MPCQSVVMHVGHISTATLAIVTEVGLVRDDVNLTENLLCCIEWSQGMVLGTQWKWAAAATVAKAISLRAILCQATAFATDPYILQVALGIRPLRMSAEPEGVPRPTIRCWMAPTLPCLCASGGSLNW